MKLNVKAFALACALIWGLGLFVITWWIIIFEGQSDPASAPPFIGLIYRGYHFTAVGSFLGLIWAFVDGLIGGAIFAWLYNLLLGKKEQSA
jgi:hypothetical protein